MFSMWFKSTGLSGTRLVGEERTLELNVGSCCRGKSGGGNGMMMTEKPLYFQSQEINDILMSQPPKNVLDFIA